MKNIILILFVVVLTTSCERAELPYIFGASPEERIGNTSLELQTALVSSPYGWKAALNTNLSGGYGFYVDFRENHTLSMLSDFSESTSGTPKESTYRTTWTMNATLIFDTYNYITLLQDPTPSVNGGTAGNGFRSDVEFELVKIGVDTIILKGLRYKNLLTLVKLSQDEQQHYLANGLTNSISDVRGYFANHSNNYINIEGIENKVEFVTTTTKGVVFQYVNNEGNVTSVTGKFNYELDGINFNLPIQLGASTFVRGVLEDNEFYLVTDSDQKFKIQQHSQPIMPMEMLFAYNGGFNELYIGSNLAKGVTSGFNTAYQSSVGKFAAMNPTRTLLDVKFVLNNSTTATVTTRNNNGTSTFIANATYKYTYENGIITLSSPSYDGNWTSRTTQLIDIQNWFLKGPFKVEYVTSTDPGTTNLGGLYRTEDETDFFYGSLRKL